MHEAKFASRWKSRRARERALRYISLARHDKMVLLVDRMLELNKKKHSGKLAPSELERLERQIASTDREIDGLVYALYGITDEERKLIEST